MRRDMERSLFAAVVVLVLAGPASAGEEFKAQEQVYTCKNFALDRTDHTADSQGNKQTFTIWVTGICAPRNVGSLPSGNWKHVTAEGHYDYATGATSEKVTTTADGWVAIQLRTKCSSNPWAHQPACQAPSTLDINTGTGLTGPYPVSANLLPSHLRQSLANWEGSKTNTQLLQGWNPLQPAGDPVLAITKPGSSVAANAASFELALNALHPEPGWVVELEWARIQPAKDPSIELYGSWKYNQPAAAPKSVVWQQLPRQVPIPGSFAAGEYAVRAKLKGGAENTWTSWKRFWVGNSPAGTIKPELVALGGGQTKQYGMGQPEQMVVFGEGAPQKLDPRNASALAAAQRSAKVQPSAMQTRQGKAPAGPEAGAGNTARLGAAPMEIKSGQTPSPGAKAAQVEGGGRAMASATRATLQKADLVLVTNGAGVKGNLEPNSLVGLTNIKVKNQGQADAANGQFEVELGCKPLGGGSCQVIKPSLPLPAIAKGKSAPLQLNTAFKPSQAGQYRLSLKLPPGTGAGKTFTKDVKIGGQANREVLKKTGSTLSPVSPAAEEEKPGASPTTKPRVGLTPR